MNLQQLSEGYDWELNTVGIAGLQMSPYVIQSNNFHWELISQSNGMASMYSPQCKK